jgi:hypothetical protein
VTNDDTIPSPTSAADTTQNPDIPLQSGFSIIRVLLTVLVISGVGTGGWYGFVREGEPPALAPFSGQVYFKGEPLRAGGVFTRVIDSELDGAVGALDGEGRFTLSTNGQPGAYVGGHKLAVSAFAGNPPTPTVPTQYVDLTTTPFIIKVESPSSGNVQKFTLAEETKPEE